MGRQQKTTGRPTVIITHWVHEQVIAFLETYFHVVANDTRESLTREELLKRCRHADGLMAFMPDCIDDGFLKACPRLKAIAAALKGYDNFDLDACMRRGIAFMHLPDLLTEATAELTIGLMLGLGRNLVPGDYHVRSGAFRGWRPVLYGMGLSGSGVGIIGMGAIGQAVALRLKGFNCRIRYYDPQALPQSEEKRLCALGCPLQELLASSDFVLVTAPLRNETFHLINEETIAAMKSGAYLVNTGRGSVVDENAVSQALTSGHLAGYAADVFEFEDWARTDRPSTIPPALLEHPERTLFTPHLGSAVDLVRKNVSMQAARNLVSMLTTDTLRSPDNAAT
jgi:phosphonate dehydrogenase